MSTATIDPFDDDDRTDAEQARDEGMSRAVHGGVGMARIEWLARFDKWLRQWAPRQRGQFSNDDLRAAVPVQPPSSRLWGPAMKAAMKDGVIVRVGVIQGTDPKHHTGWISVYRAAP